MILCEVLTLDFDDFLLRLLEWFQNTVRIGGNFKERVGSSNFRAIHLFVSSKTIQNQMVMNIYVVLQTRS